MKEKLNKVLAVWLCVVMVTISFFVMVNVVSENVSAGDPLKYEYVIITTNAIVENSERLDNFIYLKELYGHNVKVVTEDDFDGLTGQAPNGRAEKIRQWLIDNDPVYDIDYVLLIGDPDPDDPTNPSDLVGDIPMKYCWPNYFSWKCWDKWAYRGSPTDFFYADLTGNWDLDGDGFFGECIEVDHPTSPDPGNINSDIFSARWTGFVHCDYNEKYKFHTFSDDGVRLIIDGVKVIDNWGEHPPTNDFYTTPSDMSIGLHSITLEFREHTGDGIIQLFWQTTDSDHVKHQIIPLDHLKNESGSSDGLTGRYYNNVSLSDSPDLIRSDGEVINFIWGTGDRGPGGTNSTAEVFVGRIPIYDNDYVQLDKILRKIINYETDPGDISWRETVLLPMEPMDENTPCAHLGEAVKNDIATPAGFTSYRIYEEDYGFAPEKTPCNYNNVKNEWKNGYGMVTWATHGGKTSASHVMNITLAKELDDTKPAFTAQTSCLTGYPESKNNLGYALLKHGGIATVSASRVSWYSGGNWTSYDPTSGTYHNFAYYYTKGVIADSLPAGAALAQQKAPILEVSMNEMDFNLYGDPDCYLLTTVSNYPPVADANGPYEADEGSPVVFNASGSYDPEGDPLEYRWDFENNGVWDTDWSTSPTASYTWGDNHLGLVKVEVRDKLGFTANDTGSVIVYNVAPTITNLTMDQSNPQFILPYVHDLMFEGSFTDPGWLDTHTATWNFGDGTIVSGTLIEENNEPNATGTTTADHVYSSPGIYTVTLTVTDDDGGIGSDTMIVIVVDEFEALHDIDDYIQNLDDSFFNGNPTQRKNAFKKMIAAVHNLLVVEEYVGAIRDLRYNIRAKADGYVDGNPKNDWIIDPTAQAEICMKIDDLTAYLEYLGSQS